MNAYEGSNDSEYPAEVMSDLANLLLTYMYKQTIPVNPSKAQGPDC